MNGIFIRNATTGVLGLALVGASVLSLAQVLADEPGDKTIPNRRSYPSDDARQEAELSVYTNGAAEEREEQFRQKFVAAGGELSSLPIANIETQYIGAESLNIAVRNATGGIAIGTVLKQEILSGWVVSKLRLESTWTGSLTADVTILQVGGPVEEEGRAYAVQVASDPLLQKGSRYVLFLGACTLSTPSPAPGSYCVGGRNGAQFRIGPDGTLENWATDGTWMSSYHRRPVNDLRDAISKQSP